MRARGNQRGTQWAIQASTDQASDATARLEAAAIHYLRTGEAVVAEEELQVRDLRDQLRQEASGRSRCSNCIGCAAGKGCKRAANREAVREGKRGAMWAEEAQALVGRTFEVCDLPTMYANAISVDLAPT
jgi:hypothetical protein